MEQFFIDVREPEEFAKGHVKGARNVPPMALMSGSYDMSGIPKDAELIVYCVSGSRSNVVSHILKDRGYTHVVNGINKEQVCAKYNRSITKE